MYKFHSPFSALISLSLIAHMQSADFFSTCSRTFSPTQILSLLLSTSLFLISAPHPLNLRAFRLFCRPWLLVLLLLLFDHLSLPLIPLRRVTQK